MKRIEWIDSLKGFGIFCVTFGHLACNYLIETHIYSFHMFLFFFISGFLHHNEKGAFKKYIAKKTKALLIPFLVWNILSALVGLLLGNGMTETVTEFFLLHGSVCWNAPIWFLLQLYLVEIVYFFIEKYLPKGNYISIPMLLLLWIFVSRHNVFLKLNILPVCLLFYIFGNVFRTFYVKYDAKNSGKKIRRILAALLLLAVNIVFGVFLNKRISFTGADFGNVIYCALAALSGVLFYVLLFCNYKFPGKNKLLAYLGKNSLIIMTTQYWFFTFYDAISERILGISIWKYQNTVKALVLSALTICLICMAVEILRKISAKNGVIKKISKWFGINLS